MLYGLALVAVIFWLIDRRTCYLRGHTAGIEEARKVILPRP